MAGLEEHLRSPQVTIEEHIASRRAALTDSLKGKTAIYLDVRFWVMVREVRDGSSTNPAERKIVHHLEALVDQGRAFCPIAEPTFSELMKQGDLDQRVMTARPIDELSCGVSLLPDPLRMADEAENLIASVLSAGAPTMPQSAWTGLSYVLGDLYPTRTAFKPDQELAVQKAMYDRLWDEPLVKIASTLDSGTYSRTDERETSAARLNAANLAHRDEMNSFDDVLAQEFHGMAEFCIEAFPYLANMLGQVEIPIGPEKVLVNVVREFLRKPGNARFLPTAHLHAGIHTLFRWEYRHKQITANDLFDFRHAAAALGYCDAFLTDGGMSRTMRHKRMSLDRVHDCFVTSNREDAINYLRSLRI